VEAARRGLGSRLVLPGLTAVLGIVALLLFCIHLLTERILHHEHEAELANHAAETRRQIVTALEELTAANLMDVPAVLEAKQKTTLTALVLGWDRRGLNGMVAGPDGSPLVTTFPSEATRLILAHPVPDSGHFQLITSDEDDLHAYVDPFPAWKWRVITAKRHAPTGMNRQEIFLLAPLVSAAALLIILAMGLILRRSVQLPIAAMTSAIRNRRTLPMTGINEFDQIGRAINEAMDTIEVQTRDLEDELTERRLAENEAQGKESRILLLLQSVAEGIYGVDLDGICTFCNPAALRMLGYTEENDLLGKNIHQLIHHTRQDGTPYPESVCRALSVSHSGEGVVVDDEIFWRADGTSFPIEYRSHPIIDDGRIQGSVVAFIDISEKRESARNLLEERNKLEAILAAMGDGISIQNRNFQILFQNEVHKGFVGSHKGELCHQAYESRHSVCEGCPVALAFQDGKIHSAERAVPFPDGMRYFEINASPLKDASGAIVAGIEMVRETTGRKKAEEQLRQAQKIEGIGQLAGGVAHDFNNVLNVIIGYSGLLKRGMHPTDPLLHYVEEINAAGQRGAEISKQILMFSRQQPVSIQPVSLNGLVKAIHKMLGRLVREDILIDLRLGPDPIVVLADEGQIDQVLMNLATNARDAMPQGGTLSIGTGSTRIDHRFIHQHGYGTPGDYAVLTVTDTGTGMTAETRQRVFDPFFTTKEVGKGTGLGLAVVYGIVKSHNGYIGLSSEPGQGATFTIYLPLAAPQAASHSLDQGQAEVVPGGRETILVAEDDATLRRLTRTVLESSGYTVIEAADGQEAVDLFTSRADSVALALMDGIMPRKNGKEAILEMQRLNPRLRVLVLSGYADTIFTDDELTAMRITLLEKPIRPTVLLRRVREMLDA